MVTLGALLKAAFGGPLLPLAARRGIVCWTTPRLADIVPLADAAPSQDKAR